MLTFVKKFYPLERKIAKKIKKHGLTITISGLSAAGKTTVAKALAKAFKLKYYSAGEIFREVAKEKKIPLEKFSAVRPRWLDLTIDRKTLELAIRGGVVLDGRLTGWVAGRWAKVRIRCVAPLYVRARRMAKRDGTSVTKARKIIKERDEEDRKKYLERYGIDILDTSIYNIVIKNGRWSLEETKSKPVKVVRLILNSSRSSL